MRGLLMIEPLYHQTVAGNKTQTRRSGGLEIVNGTAKICGPQPLPDFWRYTGALISLKDASLSIQNKPHRLLARFTTQSGPGPGIICKPRYKIGEVLYLKEPTAKAKVINGKQIYAYLYGCNGHKGMISEFKWENKLFMPADRARAFIKITNIKCERLLDISDADCVAEGIESINEWTGLSIYKNYLNQPPRTILSHVTGFWNDPQQSFFSLFKFANKIKPSAEIGNPWVWVYSFELVNNYTHEQK